MIVPLFKGKGEMNEKLVISYVRCGWKVLAMLVVDSLQ